jgi:uncharacterized SAM-binding protein YcdF (DUF218 family)
MKPIYKVFFSLIIIYLFILWFIGLFNYKEKIVSFEKTSFVEPNNIVILTGGSNRIKDGLKIINNFNKSDLKNIKLLISGTGKGFTKLSVNNILSKKNDFYSFIKCCIKLDSKSKNTYSNAIQTKVWVNKNKINQFVLITSNYHMPRALLELKEQMPNINIIAYPIYPTKHEIKKWIYSFETFSLVLAEYSKFQLAKLRIKIKKIMP